MHSSTNSTAAPAISPRDLPRWLRWTSIAEVLVVTGSVLVLIWLIQPSGTPGMDLTFRILIVAWMLASNVLHRDSLQRLGIRFDNLARAARVVLPPTAIAAGVVVALGWQGHSKSHAGFVHQLRPCAEHCDLGMLHHEGDLAS